MYVCMYVYIQEQLDFFEILIIIVVALSFLFLYNKLLTSQWTVVVVMPTST